MELSSFRNGTSGSFSSFNFNFSTRLKPQVQFSMAETWFQIQLFNFIRLSWGTLQFLASRRMMICWGMTFISGKTNMTVVLFVCPVSFKSLVLWVIHYRNDSSFLFTQGLALMGVQQIKKQKQSSCFSNFSLRCI